jgi:hypothetical protein
MFSDRVGGGRRRHLGIERPGPRQAFGGLQDDPVPPFGACRVEPIAIHRRLLRDEGAGEQGDGESEGGKHGERHRAARMGGR